MNIKAKTDFNFSVRAAGTRHTAHTDLSLYGGSYEDTHSVSIKNGGT